MRMYEDSPVAVDIACIFIVAGGNRFDDYNEE